MAPTGEATLPWLQTALPARHDRVGSDTVLKKVERTTRTHYSAQFRQGKARIGDRAQCERRKGRITAGIAKGDGLAVEAYMLDRDRRSGDSRGGQSPSDLGRFNRKDDIDF